MKKIWIWLALAALLLALSACGTPETEEAAPSAATPAQEAETAAPQEETARPMPTISPDAQTLSAFSGSIQTDEQGTVYTTITRAEGLVYLPDLVAEDVTGYIYSLVVTEDTIYFAAKDEYLSLEPATLYAYDRAAGTVTALTQDASAGCQFCLVGDALLYESYTQGIQALDLTSGQVEAALPEALKLLAADSDFFYYAKDDGGIYRNDSTCTTEALVLDSYRSYYLFAQGDSLCDLTYQDSGTLAVLEFRDGSGTLRTQQVLGEIADGLYAQGDTLYAPQPQSHSIWVFDLATGEKLGTIPLPEDTGYCFIQAVTDNTLYYQTVTGLYALTLDGGECSYLGDILYG